MQQAIDMRTGQTVAIKRESHGEMHMLRACHPWHYLHHGMGSALLRLRPHMGNTPDQFLCMLVQS